MIKMEQSVRYIVNGIYVTKCYIYVGRMCPQCCKALRYEKIEISTKVEDKWTNTSSPSIKLVITFFWSSFKMYPKRLAIVARDEAIICILKG